MYDSKEYWYNELIKCSKERDELIMSNHKVIQDNTKLQRKLDDVVGMVNAYVTAERAYSGESAYNLLENELDRIMEDE
ncbi:hypothetical protein [Staphylococcus pseudintermedius]|uniref:hypothetical protein n=1 Tax=Staphylococcus pseudintermedius TaxID=283734 RepID=UPI0028FD6B34|nr:hypothetical protein [Staphylococcus pseudintermedius]MDU0381726.1 hypothetical protein [Staphylococcus pseudintermedius]